MNRKLILFVLLASLILPLRSLFGDMGQVTVCDAQVNETSQEAIILHGGPMELLILGTDLHAGSGTGIFRFISFPTEPQLSLAPTGLIRNHSRFTGEIFNLQAKLGR